jgi:subtilisin family serine protease
MAKVIKKASKKKTVKASYVPKKGVEIRLPDFEITEVVSSLSEVVDWGLINAGVPNTWTKTQGEGVTVFLLDTAGKTFHSDLANNVAGGANFSSSKSFEDVSSHGTHCAGIICAEKNGGGVVGVAPKAKVFLIKVLNDSGLGGESNLEAGLKFCYECYLGKQGYPKPDIVSMSLGSSLPFKRAHEWIKKLYEANIPVICAAGNTGKEGVNYPAKYDETIAIGAYDRNGNLANFSTIGDELDFIAPGVEIYSTIPPDKYGIMSGTSMACPFVAGIVALLISKHRKQEAETGLNDCKTVEQVKEHLKKYSKDVNSVGFDKQTGFGIIDVDELIGEGALGNPVPAPKPPQPAPVKKKKKTWWQRLFGLALQYEIKKKE